LDQPDTLRRGTECRSQLIHIPTGLGKTAAVVLAWLWNRIHLQNPRWPRRLVYCLPMRTLVEQTRDAIEQWLDNLYHADVPALQAAGAELEWLVRHSPVVLMGGEDSDSDKKDWDIYPEKPCILIGTQDMLLSRALNRGYGMSRYRWPMHFALLNNDCLWVLDEIQLMGPGLSTACQLEAFRAQLGSRGSASFWMSATLQSDWLKTVDFQRPSALPGLTLDEADLGMPEVLRLREARKPVQKIHARMDDPKNLAAEVLKAHGGAGGLTLVVVNTVRRARELVRELQRRLKSADAAPRLLLIHSRFRPPDRRALMDQLLAPPTSTGTIAVTTQVVEAGVDVSATTLFTELAPWSSLVQRFGRCNRRGADNNKARVFWVDLPSGDSKQAQFCAPYAPEDLQQSLRVLKHLAASDVGPASLPDNVALPYRPAHVLRRKDFIELFDTTPDLAGNDLDIEQFIRDVEECDVQVFWREWPAETQPSADLPEGRHDELCAVPLSEFKNFAGDPKRRQLVYRWDALAGSWETFDERRLCPGQIYLVHASAGGYTPESGWDPASSAPVPVLAPAEVHAPPEANDSDVLSESKWQSIAEHTNAVCDEVQSLLGTMEVGESTALKLAARWHDRGKAHPGFLARLNPGALAEARDAGFLNCGFAAKAPADAWLPPAQTLAGQRKRFRHELASALAVLMAGGDQIPDDVRDLVAYLVAAHHGKVRLSIRSLPEETPPPDGRRFARGIWDQDDLPATDLGGGVLAPAVKLSLEPMELGLCEQPPFQGQPSWTERMLRLRDTLGPCHLAWLEALLRAADIRVSAGLTPPGGAGTPGGLAGAVEPTDIAGSRTTTPALSSQERSLVAELVEDGLRIQDQFRPEPLYKQSGKHPGTRTTTPEVRDAFRTDGNQQGEST